MKTYVIRPQIVARSLAVLRNQKTHALFPGYLHLQKRSIELGRLNNLTPNFLAFYKSYFQIPDHPLGSPYVRAFIDQKPSELNLWLNANVAGSYAQSSLRSGQPFREIVRIENGRYSLLDNHAQLAFTHLLNSHRVQVAELSAFLYRDYGLLGEQFTINDLVDVFAYEFGYSNEPGSDRIEDFDTLFDASSSSSPEEWFEIHDEI